MNHTIKSATQTIKNFSAMGLVVFSSLIAPFFAHESSYGYSTPKFIPDSSTNTKFLISIVSSQRR
jgi:hypothetical protein